MIASSTALLATARSCLSTVERLALPVGRGSADGRWAPAEIVYAVLQPCLILWGPPKLGDDQAGQELKRRWLELYAKALGEFPREALELAVDAWIAGGRPFFPFPADLAKLAEREAVEIRMIAYRLRKAVEKAAQAKPVERTAEDRARGKALLADLRDPVTGRIRLLKSAS